MVDSNPPFLETYKSFFEQDECNILKKITITDGCNILPVIDLCRLLSGSENIDAKQCKRDIANAASEWGFFQVVNHGIPQDLLERVRSVFCDVFRQPFEKKAKEKLLDHFPVESYRWGTPSATSLQQLSWSEAYHIPLALPTPQSCDYKHSTCRLTIEEFEATMSQLAQQLLGILAEGLGCEGTNYLKEKCTCNTCYLRLNRYPPCPLVDDEVFGLIPHTDSDFLTILLQDQVGGLQLMKDGRWIAVKPNPSALVINIGDLCEAWSNRVYKSVEHRVMSNPKVERFSVAYFLCPSDDTMIQSHTEPAMYRKFTFKEYRQQVQEDVKLTGHKVGLARFLASGH